MLNCIPRGQITKLKEAARAGEFSMETLFKMSSSERKTLLGQYLGKEQGSGANALFERAMASNQKQAVANWMWKQFEGHKPLYLNITLAESKAMREAGVTIRELRPLSSTMRIKRLSTFIGSDSAKVLNDRFETARRSNTLANWEERTLGTKEMHADKELQGSFSKLTTLDDMGLLKPDQLEKFMEGFVSQKLGVDITAEQSSKLSDMVEETQIAFDKIRTLDDWTGQNYKDVVSYFTKRVEAERYVKSLAKVDAVDIANDAITTMRNNILGSFRALRNSALYQVIPSLERAITKRLVSAGVGRMDATFRDKLVAKLSAGIATSKEGKAFIGQQLKLTLDIYNKTGYDISRMLTLETEQRFIGEPEKVISGMALRDSKGFISKARAISSRIAKATGVFPKWFAGGTDTVVAATTRASTTWLWAKEMARLESRIGKLPNGMDENARFNQLLKEAYSFDPKDPAAIKIQEAGIRDAHSSNNTQPDGLATAVLKARNLLRIGDVELGRVFVPFAKISTTAISRGLKLATGYDAVKSVIGLAKASNQKDTGIRERLFAKHTTGLIATVGLTGAAILISTMLDVDDYVPPYIALSAKERKAVEASGARPGSIRIGNKWIPLRYLPLVGILISSIMNARKIKASGGNPVVGYLSGTLAQVLDLPVLSEAYQALGNIKSSATADETIDIMNSAGLDGKTLWNWAKVRVVPSMLSHDIYNAVLPEAKYDFLGREVDRGGAFRSDKTNELLLEFSRLDDAEFAPTILDYNGKWMEPVMDSIGEKAYDEKYAELSRKYSRQVEELISRPGYNRLSDEDKQKRINEIRQKVIIGGLERYATRELKIKL